MVGLVINGKRCGICYILIHFAWNLLAYLRRPSLVSPNVSVFVTQIILTISVTDENTYRYYYSNFNTFFSCSIIQSLDGIPLLQKYQKMKHFVNICTILCEFMNVSKKAPLSLLNLGKIVNGRCIKLTNVLLLRCYHWFLVFHFSTYHFFILLLASSTRDLVNVSITMRICKKSEKNDNN